MEVPLAVVESGLRYATDQSPGITRRKAGKAFAYYGPKSERITDKRTLDRIHKLVIPPAWHDVWIARSPNAYLQVTGRDDKGRKQAIYHPDFRAHQEQTKFSRLAHFGRALAKIRKRVDKDLRRTGLPKERVVAAVVRLLEETLIRIGNRRYARNGSFGLTTMRMNHLDLGNTRARFHFTGKSGKEHDVTCRDRRLCRVMRLLQDLPGQELFMYRNGDGEPQNIRSEDVNAYLREASGEEFTAKDFRTWAATVEAVRLMREREIDTPRAIPGVVKEVAKRLGNTPAVCRSSYIHPAVLSWAEPPDWVRAKLPRPARGLDPYERLVLEAVLA